jgi:hypothetical protein
MPTVVCPLCGNRRARRGCPAVGQQICPVCCGTKRLVEINCPADCVWLASAREHPPAARLRQRERDRGLLMPLMIDFSERQVQLFFLLANFIARYEPPELQPLFDEDVEQGVGALASTYETASRGVIYEHRASSLPAERFANALKPVLAEMGRGHGSAFERDAAGVLRRLAALAHDVRKGDAANRRAFIDMLRRLVAEFPVAGDSDDKDPGEEPPRPPSLIVP